MGIVNPCQIVIFYPEKQNKINHFVKHKKIFSAQDNIKKANLEFQLSLSKKWKILAIKHFTNRTKKTHTILGMNNN